MNGMSPALERIAPAFRQADMSIINEALKQAAHEHGSSPRAISSERVRIGTCPGWRRFAILGMLVSTSIGGGVGIGHWLLPLPQTMVQADERGQPVASALWMEQLTDQLAARLNERLDRHIDQLTAQFNARLTQMRDLASERLTAVPSPPVPPSPPATPPISHTKPALIAWIQARRAEGLSLAQIAQQLNEAHVPTLTGTRTWQKGTVSQLIRPVHRR